MSKELKVMSDTTKIVFGKYRPEATIPTKRNEDAAFDVYAIWENEYELLPAGVTRQYGTGLVSAFSEKYAIILKERGSTGSAGIGQRCGVIDSGYRGEWLVPVTNHNNVPILFCAKENEEQIAKKLGLGKSEYVFYPYEKAITQALVVEVPPVVVEEESAESVIAYWSERRDGRLGSSGK